MKDFKVIPGFSRYTINTGGEVFDTLEQKPRQWTVAKHIGTKRKGYRRMILTSDTGKLCSVSRHRTLMIVFKPHVNSDMLVVNHINGVGGDDWLENLEWLTHRQNAMHAGHTGLSSKFIKVTLMDLVKNVEHEFDSLLECSALVNMVKDVPAKWIRKPNNHVWNQRWRLKRFAEEWSTEDLVYELGKKRPVLIKELKTGRETCFIKATDAANYVGVTLSTLLAYAENPNQPLLPNHTLVKLAVDKTPWREVVNPELEELLATSGKSVIRWKDENTWEIYGNCRKCAEASGLQFTTLNWRLKRPMDTVHSDGWHYTYLTQLLGSAPSERERVKAPKLLEHPKAL